MIKLSSYDWQMMVHEFHNRFGLEIGLSPQIRNPGLRTALIAEEAKETVDAINRGDLTEAVDGLCDLIYVAIGTAATFGIDLNPFMAEVHRANMAKVGGKVREDGKILKPEGWQPPRIKELLDQMRPSLGKPICQCGDTVHCRECYERLKKAEPPACSLLPAEDPCCLPGGHSAKCIARSRIYTKTRPEF